MMMMIAMTSIVNHRLVGFQDFGASDDSKRGGPRPPFFLLAIQFKPGRAPGHGPASISAHQIRGGSCSGVLTSIRSTSSGAKMEGLGVSRDDIGGNKIDQTRRAYIKMPMSKSHKDSYQKIYFSIQN